MTETKKQQKPPVVAGGAVAALVPTTLDELYRIGDTCCAMHGLDPKDPIVRAKVAGIMCTGMELGMLPMAAYRSIDVIPGQSGNRMRLNAAGCRALCLSNSKCRSFLVRDIRDGTGAVVGAMATGQREDNGDKHSVEVRLTEFQHLFRKGGAWDRYPREMLIARATTRLANELFGDITMGMAVDNDPVVETAPAPAAPPRPAPRDVTPEQRIHEAEVVETEPEPEPAPAPPPKAAKPKAAPPPPEQPAEVEPEETPAQPAVSDEAPWKRNGN